MPESISSGVTIEQAFHEAVKEHSTQVEQAAPAEVSTPATPDPTPTQDTAAAGASTIPATDSETPDLISETDWTAIQAKFPGDPAKQRAELNTAWTRKTQTLADERKAVAAERQQLEADRLALKAPPLESAAAMVPIDEMAEARKLIGPDLDFLAEPVARVIDARVDAREKQFIEKYLKPVMEEHQQIQGRYAKAQSDALMQTFTTKHPDWSQHDEAMAALTQEMPLLPTSKLDPLEYMERLYRLVTFDSQLAKARAESGAEAVTRLAKGAEQAERHSQPVSQTQVSRTPPANATLEQAFAAAKRGEKWD